VLNSFAKSYIVERAAVAGIGEAGVRGILVNNGGDVVVRGALREPWASRIRARMRTMRRH
jgi:thiamine biosynthesis lipoprotein ApbE